jgi:hypothetical protein
MIFITFAITGGLLLGVLLYRYRLLIDLSNKLVSLLVLVLVLLMGFNLGTNTVLLENIRTLGFHSLVLAFGCSLGSLVMFYLSTKVLVRNQE